MSESHNTIISAVETYTQENDKFVEKGVKSAGTRARKALAELGKAVKLRRKEIQEAKNAAKPSAQTPTHRRGICHVQQTQDLK